MCSICGALALTGSLLAGEPFAAELLGMIRRGASRGSDSFGVIAVDAKRGVREWHSFEPPRLEELQALIGEGAVSLVATTRAVPTTEWRPGRRLEDVQPFAGDGWIVAHNGTVANDRELRSELGIVTPTAVDSAVLPGVFASLGFEAGVQRIAGSFALAAVDTRRPDRLYLARNYKPLSLSRRASAGALLFASTAAQLGREGFSLDSDLPVEVPPYHWLVIDRAGAHRLWALPGTERGAGARTLVVASGGLDSTVVAAKLVREGFDTTLLHFRYGCRAEAREAAAVNAIASSLGCRRRFVDLRWLGKLGASSLTVPGAEIAHGEAGAEFPHEWVPARNMLMISAACAIADAGGYSHVALGTNLEEGGAYPDNTQEFVAAMDRASDLGTQSRACVIAPLGNLVKHQIVRLGLELGAPLELTWSCYRDGERHCGDCGPCYMRQRAFAMNERSDPVFAA